MCEVHKNQCSIIQKTELLCGCMSIIERKPAGSVGKCHFSSHFTGMLMVNGKFMLGPDWKRYGQSKRKWK